MTTIVDHLFGLLFFLRIMAEKARVEFSSAVVFKTSLSVHMVVQNKQDSFFLFYPYFFFLVCVSGLFVAHRGGKSLRGIFALVRGGAQDQPKCAPD